MARIRPRGNPKTAHAKAPSAKDPKAEVQVFFATLASFATSRETDSPSHVEPEVSGGLAAGPKFGCGRRPGRNGVWYSYL